MDMTGEQFIPASREKVWEGLNDPDVLRQCIPGCESMDRTEDGGLAATVVAKVGPVKAKFAGAVSFSNLNPPNSYTLSGKGQGGAAGFAKGAADVILEDAEGGTLLKYTVKADIGGKLAQLGSRLIDGVAQKMANDFFGKFSEIVGGPAEEAAPEAAEAAAPAPAEAAGGISPAVWIVGLIIAIGVLLYFFS